MYLIEFASNDATYPIPLSDQIHESLAKFELTESNVHYFKMREFLSRTLREVSIGELKIKFLSRRIRPQNSSDMLWDIFQLIILLFNNSKLPKISGQMLKNSYTTELSNELSYSFQYIDLDKQTDQEVSEEFLLFSNLNIFLTQTSTFTKDMDLIIETISKLSSYSRVNLLLLAYSNDFNEISAFEKKLLSKLKDQIAQEKFSNLKVVPLCFHQPLKTAQRKTVNPLGVQRYKKMLLSYVL